MLKLKDLLTEWNDTSFRDLPKRWSKPVMKGREPDGLTEFERIGGTDVELGKVYTDIDRPPFKIEEKMSDEKRSFLMLRIYGDSWKINLGKVFSGINKGKPTLIKKGLKEIKILNKKIEEMIEDLI
tara:strand:- start:254 stop:631 length:378 start_codon:yes stop_codon:yes gene_type:complete